MIGPKISVYRRQKTKDVREKQEILSQVFLHRVEIIIHDSIIIIRKL